MNPEQVVRQFCTAVETQGPKQLAGYFTEDAVYHNIPLDPVKGRAAIEATLTQFVGPNGGGEFQILALATTGSKVMTERIDRLEMGGKKIEIPVMGIFEVAPDGRISAWRDYFDMQQVVKQMS